MYYCVLYVMSVFITLFVVTLTCILGQQQNVLSYTFQAQKLIRERLCESLSIDEYSVGKCLSVSYWK